jgi:hypothetical protein
VDVLVDMAGRKIGGGTLLAIKTDGSDYRILQQFGPKTGLNNAAAPTTTSDGKRLICTQNGGKYPLGVLYSMRIPTSVRY